MRMKVAIIILLIGGIGLTASLLTGNRTLSPQQLKTVRTVCLECHSNTPTYDAVTKVHNKHATFNCSQCHSYDGGLRVAEHFHVGLKWLGVGVTLFALTGIIANLFIINRKGNVH